MADEKKAEDLRIEEDKDGTVVVSGLEQAAEEESNSGAPEGKTGASEEEEAGAGEAAGHVEDENETDEEQGHEGETEEDAEARRQRNRKRRQDNKARRNEYIDSLRRELAARDRTIEDLVTRVTTVEQRTVGSQIHQIDSAIAEAERIYGHFKAANQKAIEQADGAAAVEAQEKMFAAANRHAALLAAKKNMARQETQPAPMNPRVQANAQAWVTKNTWYNPNGGDMDSDIVLKIDDVLVKEGWDPSTTEYWQELDSRVEKYLPHRRSSGYNRTQQGGEGGEKPQPRPKPRVPVARGGGGGDGGNKGQYRLSAERVKALKDADMWDDPVKRNAAIRRFQDFDRQNDRKN